MQRQQHDNDQPSSVGDGDTSIVEPPNSAAATTTTTGPIPALPAPGQGGDDGSSSGSSSLRTLEVDGKAVALDNLGPMVVGRDGTVSRIANWGEMTDMERQNTVRILCKRNQVRLAALRGDDGQGSGT